ncbi:MAG: twin-arginine translocase TatA/TatE family subunit [Thermomicrobium sp.]|nr:twin-arginine translocase TatA/TatE family subunit [Thermomicrobium sp.]
MLLGVAMIEGLFQPTHLLLLLVIVLIVFGPGKLPQVGAAIGRSIREFRQSVRDEEGSSYPQHPTAGEAGTDTTR